MAPVPEKILNWLYSVLPSEYPDVNRTYSDVAETLSHYPSLSPKTEVYTYENGASALLLQLSGTLPVTFRGATYAFPIQLWVPHRYPQEAPMVYVVPSQDMLVRPGQHVSGDGRVYHPYLAQWGKYWDKSTIFDFLAVLRGVFTKEPPVRSKQQVQFNSSNTAPAPPPVPPTPEEWRRSMQGSPAPSPAPLQRPQPPPKPPKPYESSPNRPLQQPEAQYDRARPPSTVTYAPQIPERPYGRPDSWQQPSGQSQVIPQRQPSYDTNPPTPLGRPLRPHIQSQGSQQPFQAASYELGSPVSPITPEGQPRNSLSRYQQPFPPQQVPTSHPYPPPSQHRGNFPQGQFQQPPLNVYPPSQRQQAMMPPTSQIPPKPKQPIPDLLDSPLDVTLPSQSGQSAPIPAPPIPPNPEKDALLTALSSTLVAQLRQNITDNINAIAPLQAQQQALREAHSRLQSELDQLQQLDAALASNEHILRDAMVEADRVMEDARTRKVPDVDEVLVAPFVVGGQLYILCAEERACADALFVLGRALDKGRVGTDVFIKQTRSLAREQFLKKALIKKISKGMALDEYQMR
ncbi:UEV-domain-containing protein [Mytilinidion resinicola]|uniref:UEV-domain-containing protein n=1 Tax=Mytilinidion resinicola TaxID=574789 RepID=A0A6A6Z769_9PEZI|nr:UEV-domain-containing protein [Mytilinidion resinicola]KAF2816951.1 UEV-domain-containing protein [Mytilinidion resinicola]